MYVFVLYPQFSCSSLLATILFHLFVPRLAFHTPAPCFSIPTRLSARYLPSPNPNFSPCQVSLHTPIFRPLLPLLACRASHSLPSFSHHFSWLLFPSRTLILYSLPSTRFTPPVTQPDTRTPPCLTSEHHVCFGVCVCCMCCQFVQVALHTQSRGRRG